MDDVLGYRGKKVVVTGAASGMGAATARLLVDLGAEVIGVDLKPTDVAGASIVCVASNAGLGWQQRLADLLPLVTTEGFEAAKAWCEANPEAIANGYGPSKQYLNAWVAHRGTQLVADGIRLNCVNPGPTETAMMPAFEALAGKDVVDAFVGPSGRRCVPEEQAWPMLFLNSPRSSYVAAEALHVDGGFLGAMVTNQLQATLPGAFEG